MTTARPAKGGTALSANVAGTGWPPQCQCRGRPRTFRMMSVMAKPTESRRRAQWRQFSVSEARVSAQADAAGQKGAVAACCAGGAVLVAPASWRRQRDAPGSWATAAEAGLGTIVTRSRQTDRRARARPPPREARSERRPGRDRNRRMLPGGCWGRLLPDPEELDLARRDAAHQRGRRLPPASRPATRCARRARASHYGQACAGLRSLPTCAHPARADRREAKPCLDLTARAPVWPTFAPAQVHASPLLDE